MTRRSRLKARRERRQISQIRALRAQVLRLKGRSRSKSLRLSHIPTAYQVGLALTRTLTNAAASIRTALYSNPYGHSSAQILTDLGDKATKLTDVLTAIDVLSATPIDSGA